MLGMKERKSLKEMDAKELKFHSRACVRAILVMRLMQCGVFMVVAGMEKERAMWREIGLRLSVRLGANKYYDVFF